MGKKAACLVRVAMARPNTEGSVRDVERDGKCHTLLSHYLYSCLFWELDDLGEHDGFLSTCRCAACVKNRKAVAPYREAVLCDTCGRGFFGAQVRAR